MSMDPSFVWILISRLTGASQQHSPLRDEEVQTSEWLTPILNITTLLLHHHSNRPQIPFSVQIEKRRLHPRTDIHQLKQKLKLDLHSKAPIHTQNRIKTTLNYRIRESGFQTSMVPSTRPPAISPRENSSEPDTFLPHERRLKRSELGDSAMSGRSRSSDWKSSPKISRLAEELKERSTAPAMVPVAK